MVKLGHLALSSPVHTADCERGFSAQNIVLTPLRNRLSPKTQDMLLRVMIQAKKNPGSDMFERAYSAWYKSKNRKVKV